MLSAIATARDRLLSSDPGLTRLMLASRVTVAVLLTVGSLDIAAGATHMAAVPLALIGAVVAMQTSLSVNDPKARATTLLAPIPGTLGAVLGAWFANRGILAEIAFLGVLFSAIAVRARGPRWTAFGTIATMTYFVALFLDATFAQLPALIGAVVAGTAFSFLSRFVLLRDQPAWIARRTIAALEARVRLVAVGAQTLVGTGDYANARRQLETTMQRLNETATSVEARLGDAAGDELRIVFDVALAAEDLAAAARRLRESGKLVPRTIRLALLALGRGQTARAARIAARVPADESVSDEARSLGAAVADSHAALGRLEATSGALAHSDAPWGAVAGQQPPVLPQAIQVTVAAAASMLASEALGSQRWYWSVLAAYFVFSGTSSSAETRGRAWARIVGTAAGVVAGILVGHFAQGHPLLDGAAIFTCLFLGVYLLRISYSMMIFFITAMLALLYFELGRFSNALLEMRLIETAIGAFFGGLAATVVFPVRTRDVVCAKATETLVAVGDVVRTSIARLLDPNTDADPLAAAHALETRVQEFVARAKPAVSSPVLRGTGRELRRWIVSLSACSYYARTLARVVDRSNVAPPLGALAPLWRLDELIATNMKAAEERINGRAAATTDTRSVFDEIRAATMHDGGANESLQSAVYLLERVNRTIARLTSERDPKRPP